MLMGLGPRQFHARKTLSSFRNVRNDGGRSFSTVLKSLLLVIISLYVFLVGRWYTTTSTSKSVLASPNISSIITSTSGALSSSCSFRKYPPHRYFHRKERPLPSFLSQTEYIFGEFPSMLPTSQTTTPSTHKLCVDQSRWDDAQVPVPLVTSLPFADGTNPSILRLRDNPQLRLDGMGWSEDAFFLATICMTNSQCAWEDTPEQIRDFKISTQSEPSTVRTVLLVLNRAFEVLEETTIETLVDARFGRKIKPSQPPIKQIFALDDARLFTYQQELWVSYREGPNFGYDKQVLNRVHLERKDGKLHATLKASEVETLCCGRNMALLDNIHTHELQALTWVDPITVVTVDLKQSRTSPKRRRRLSLDNRRQYQSHMTSFPKNASSVHRRLVETKRRSEFHGTNGFMVYLPETKEYLGIGHFHRPPGREANKYARFGHHYTHAFFTIPDQPPYYLKRLSPELLLPSFAYPDDAEIIQFWSGLDRVDDDTLALAYGINDCEGAATYIDMAVVENLLRKVPSSGMEVVDLLKAPMRL